MELQRLCRKDVLTIWAAGSSSGSAILVSASVVPIAFGTETDSSIIAPAKINGVVGIKPTVGLTSRSGIVPISDTFDTVGAFGRTVADAVHGLDAIVGADGEDPATTSGERRLSLSYSTYLSNRSVVRGARFGLPIRRFFDVIPAQQKDVMNNILTAILDAGARVYYVEIPSATDRIAPSGNWDWYASPSDRIVETQTDMSRREHGEPSKSEFTLAKTDAYNGINKYLANLESNQVQSLEDVVKYNEDNTGTEGAHPGDHPAFATGQVRYTETSEGRD